MGPDRNNSFPHSSSHEEEDEDEISEIPSSLSLKEEKEVVDDDEHFLGEREKEGGKEKEKTHKEEEGGKENILLKIVGTTKFREIIAKVLKKEFNLELISLEEEEIEGGEEKEASYYLAKGKDELKGGWREILTLICTKSFPMEICKEDIQHFWQDIMNKRARYGIFITPGYFTRGVIEVASHLPIKLVSGRELSELLSNLEHIEAKEAFLSEKTNREAKEFFEQKKKKKFLGIFGTQEQVESVEGAYRPVGLFTIRKLIGKGDEEEGEKETKSQIFVDLHTAEIYKIERDRLKKDKFLRKTFELEKETREHVLSAIEHGVFDFEHLSKKDLVILKKKGFLKKHLEEKKEEKNLLVLLSDELLFLVRIFTDFFGEVLNMKPTKSPSTTSTEMKKESLIQPPEVTPSYNLNNFLEKSENIDTKEFKPDQIKYEVEEVNRTLSRLYGGEEGCDVTFDHLIYLPYYKCRYLDKNLNYRHSLYFPTKFKHFAFPSTTTLGTKHSGIYTFIDKTPEIPFLFLALAYSAYIYPDIKKIAFVFSSSLIFILLALILGILLKAIFKTRRKVPYLSSSVLRYGFPSLHSLTSIGTISFVYFIPEIGLLLSLALLPLGFLYIYSRLKLGVHSMLDVVGGAIIGSILGFLSGYFFLKMKILPLSYDMQLIFATLFFILPLFSIWYRIEKLR
jgi:membrane-associated phospholipid phosphatase